MVAKNIDECIIISLTKCGLKSRNLASILTIYIFKKISSLCKTLCFLIDEKETCKTIKTEI